MASFDLVIRLPSARSRGILSWGLEVDFRFTAKASPNQTRMAGIQVTGSIR